MYDKSALIELVRAKALEFGDFTLASGKKASFYLDCRKVTLDPNGANLIAECIQELLEGQLPDAIGGVYWFYLDNQYVSTYVPIYAGVQEISPVPANAKRRCWRLAAGFWARSIRAP